MNDCTRQTKRRKGSRDPYRLPQEPQEQDHFQHEDGVQPCAVQREAKDGDACPVVFQVRHCNRRGRNEVRLWCTVLC